MAYLISHFYEGGTQAQYDAVVEAVHPPGGLPAGQIYHAAAPTDGGFLVIAVWESKEANDGFIQNTLMPALQSASQDAGFPGPPQEHSGEVTNLLTS